MTRAQSRPILLVEDNPDDVLFMEQAFRKIEMREPLRIARDGLEAIQYLEGTGGYAERKRFPLPALILLDLKLPKRSGHQVLEWKKGRAELSSVYVMVITSSGDLSDVRRAYEQGAFSYHLKPAGFKDLVALARLVHQCWLTLGSDSGSMPPRLAGAETPV
jgi:CheY-like chemotaxis protein